MRTQLLQELRQDYIRTARSKGLPEHTVVRRHAMKNAISPILTLLGMQAGGMIGGTVLIEKIFSWPGLGSYALDAIASLDLLVVSRHSFDDGSHIHIDQSDSRYILCSD